jgi:alkylhydroperoxidase/carboxymuconolactone decarboxylase family protein YurZ
MTHRSELDSLVESAHSGNPARAVAPAGYEVASSFWQGVFESRHLSARVKELVLLALHASPSSINEQAIVRHIDRARAAGASDADILDVLLSIVGLSNHAMYFCVPILIEEFRKSATEPDARLPGLRPDVEAIKQDFIKTRGFWNQRRDEIAALMPDYFKALSALSMEPWRTGSLSPKEREFLYIAIDCSITHMHEAGLRMHIGNAIRHGATRDEILEVFQLSALMGMEGYILGCRALNEQARTDGGRTT